jgi:hypothetical protein
MVPLTSFPTTIVRPENAANDAMTSRMSVSWKVTVIGGCCDCCAGWNNALACELIVLVTVGSEAGGVGVGSSWTSTV